MIIRHRPPTIFNIYMVDVLCCALGCVVLLWQLYHHESEEQTARARDANALLDKAGLEIRDLTGELADAASERDRFGKERDDLASELERRIKLFEKLSKANDGALARLAKAELDIRFLTTRGDKLEKEWDSAKKERDDAKREIVLLSLDLKKFTDKLDRKTKLAIVLESELETLRKTHQAAEALITALKGDLALLSKKSSITSSDLAARIKAHAEALERASVLEKRLTALEKELKLKTVELVLAGGKIDVTEKKLEDAETRAKRLEKLYADLAAVARDRLDKITLSDKQLKSLEEELAKRRKELEGSGKKIDELLDLKDALTLKLLASNKDLTSLREAAESRFEGITLDGKHVVFVIDISGSMIKRDQSTTDEVKWQRVIETIERFAGGLAEAESYQVVVFSTEARILLGDEPRWEKFNRATSPKRIGDALRAIKPDGGTNLYAGLEQAFAFRPLGLQTVYLFSDGLPTVGPGVRPDEEEKLPETVLSEKRGKVIRQQLKTVWNPEGKGRRVRVNAIGFFFESPDVGAFLWGLARENEGSFVGLSRP